MKKIRLIFLILLFSLLIISCGKLSRSEATNKLKIMLKFTTECDFPRIAKGSCDMLYRITDSSSCQWNGNHILIDSLVNEGYVIKNGTYWGLPRIQFTEKSYQYITHDHGDKEKELVFVKVGEFENITIEGISQEGNSANVDYSYTIKPYGPFGGLLKNSTSIRGTAYFRKYDNGWKIE
jgi:hypothetical protein